MPYALLSTIVNSVQDIFYALVFVGCAVTAYLTLQQPRLKPWLAETTALVRVVAFLVLTELLALPFNVVIGDVFALPRGLIGWNSGLEPVVQSGIQCLGGIIVLACLGVGGWLLARRTAQQSELSATVRS